MHFINDANANVIMAWCALLTIAGAIIGFWSKRQDRAIKRLEIEITSLKSQRRILAAYIWRLLRILERNQISYPDPPVQLYQDITADPETENNHE